VNPRTGRLHTSFNQTVAATGRLSSSDPNLQNIPIRTPLGREIRKGFVAEPGHVLLAVDYSQIELRILAHFSGDEPLVRAFRERDRRAPPDGAVVFDVPIDRSRPISARAPRRSTSPRSTGRALRARRAARHLARGGEGVHRRVLRALQRRAALPRRHGGGRAERGYVETLLGRRRFIPELQSRNWNIRQFGERVAQNTPIQGTAADLIKKAMIDVDAALERRDWGARLLLTCTTSCSSRCPRTGRASCAPPWSSCMENAIELTVPIDVDVASGKSWYEAKGG
jgi:DNA polymerase-1